MSHFQAAAQLIEEAQCLEDIFGMPPGDWRTSHPTANGVMVKSRWRELATRVHPDRFEGPQRERAEQVCALLNALHERAQQSIDAATYGARSPLFEQSATLVSTPKGRYAIGEALATGDIATLYAGKSEVGEALIVKIAHDEQDSDLMTRERRALTRLHEDESPQLKHIPRFLDTFTSPAGTRGNILSACDEGALDLAQVRKRYSAQQPFPPVHAVWVLRRALSALGWAHRQGVVHANICPEHVMIRAEDHNVWLVDWCYACVDPAKTGQGFACVNAPYSPPEVAQKKPPLPASDLYALGKTMIFLLGGDPQRDWLPESVPRQLARFLSFMTRESPLGRGQDAWALYKQLKGVRDDCFGTHRFRELELPPAAT